MLVENPQICRRLEKVVARLARDPALREDLMQEGLLHLWQVECQCPGRTQSWYLQNCRFCVLHSLASGRSIDSLKRSTAANRISFDEPEGPAERMDIPGRDDVVGTVSFHDLQAVLSRHLTRRERGVLEGLADGLRLREVASQVKLSYPTALKYRRRIAALVSKLDIPIFPAPRPQGRAPILSDNSHNGGAAQPRKTRSGGGQALQAQPVC